MARQCWSCFGSFDRPAYLDCLPRCPHCQAYQPGYRTLPGRPAAVHTKERAVVWQHPLTGEVRYPGRNDAPMPDRYAAQGYERREFVSAHDLSRFEREKNVANEALNYNSGNCVEDELPPNPADSRFDMPCAPGGDDTLTANGVSFKLASRPNA